MGIKTETSDFLQEDNWVMSEAAFRWACPICRSPLQTTNPTQMTCTALCNQYDCVDGVWHMLTPEKAAYYEQFVQNYDTVRQGEQWGAGSEAYYRALPYEDLSGRHPDIWRVRAISFDALLSDIVEPLSMDRKRPLRILDAGAGNGWISYRLAMAGHALLAIDLRLDSTDGLGAYRQYGDEVCFVRAQATFEQIPLLDEQLDLVIFGGSIHYATSIEETLREALRVLRHDGQMVILDSPVYKRPHSGDQMVAELQQQLAREHDVDASILPHENYLTPARLNVLGAELGIRWRLKEPFYGWRWALAPWLARLRRRRQPARFYLISGEPQP